MKVNKKTFPIRLFLVILLLLDIHCLYLFKYPDTIERYLGGNNKYWILGGISIILYIFYNGMTYTKSPEHKSAFLSKYIPISIVCTFILFINAGINFSAQSFNDTLRIGGNLFWYAQAFLYYYLFTKDRTENRVIKVFNTICTVWYLVLILQYISSRVNGGFLFDFNSIFSNGVQYRNDSFRVHLFSLPNLMIIYNYYELYKANRLLDSKTIKAMIRFLLGMFCMLFVQQTRGYTLSVFVAIGIITLFLTENANKKLRSVIIVLLFILYAMSTGDVSEFFATFSETSELGGNTTYRLLAIDYYWQKFLENPIFGGVGFAAEEFYFSLVHSGSGRCYVDDVGIFGALAMYGVFIILFYFVPLIRMAKIAFKIRKVNYDKFILLLSITAFMLITTGSLIMINKQRMFTLPFIIALAEYYETESLQRLESKSIN